MTFMKWVSHKNNSCTLLSSNFFKHTLFRSLKQTDKHFNVSWKNETKIKVHYLLLMNQLFSLHNKKITSGQDIRSIDMI